MALKSQNSKICGNHGNLLYMCTFTFLGKNSWKQRFIKEVTKELIWRNFFILHNNLSKHFVISTLSLWYDSMIYVDFTKYFAKDNEFFHHNAHDEALHTHSVWKWKIYFHQNKFRHINYLVILLVKTSFSRNFFQYVVNFWNFHSAVWNYRI